MATPILLSKETLDGVVERILDVCRVPGLAIGVVEDDTIWTKAYGYSDVAAGLKLTVDTCFPAGSTTKSFTAAAASMLVHSSDHRYRNLQWASCMKDLLPNDFEMEDAETTAKVTVEDCIFHRSGMPTHHADLGAQTVRDSTRGLRFLPMSKDDYGKWQYSNHMYWAVCHAIEALSGQTMAEFLRQAIWGPLAMDSTYLSIRDVQASSHALAKPHETNLSNPLSFRPLDVWDDTGLSGAGGCSSTVNDYSKWLRACLGRAPDSPLPAQYFDELLDEKVLTSQHSSRFPGEPIHYGLGFYMTRYRGHKVLYHPGGVIGWTSYMVLIPDLGLGACAMCNVTSEAAVEAAAWHIVDERLGVPLAERFDVLATVPAIREGMKMYFDTAMERFFADVPNPTWPSTMSAMSYAGRYVHGSCGTITVDPHSVDVPDTSTDFTLNAHFPGRLPLDPLELVHVHGDSFLAKAEVAGGVVNVRAKAHFVIVTSESTGISIVSKLGIEFEDGHPENTIWFSHVEDK